MMRPGVSGACLLAVALLAPLGDQGSFALSYTVDERVSQGEPVLLSYQFRNRGSEFVSIQLGDPSGNGFFRLDVTGPTGRTETLAASIPELELPFIPVPPRVSFRDALLISNWLKFDQVGVYRIAVRFEGAVKHGQDARTSTTDVEVERSATFQVTVTPRDGAALLRRAQALRAQLTSSANRNGPGSARASNALLSIDDPAVIPVLVDLIRSEPFFQLASFRALVRIGGPEAQRTLGSLASDPDKEIAIGAQRAIAALAKRR
jgi:hypothetical protein